MKVGRRTYDLMYRTWAPWDRVGVRVELRAVLERGDITPQTHPRVVDVGCGTGANVVHLAEQGYEVTGVDLSRVALDAARSRAAAAGVEDRCRFVEADLTDPYLLPDDRGGFDLLVDASTLDDLDARGRAVLSRHLTRLARPGATLLCWCFYAHRRELPFISFTGPSRLAPGLEPGEEQLLLGQGFEMVQITRPQRFHAFLELRRRPARATPPVSGGPPERVNDRRSASREGPRPVTP